MARHLDLEEQEQLDQIKHFWNRYGNLITWVVIAVFGAVAAWNGWQYWQRNQAAQAAAMYDEVERSAQVGDTARIERVFADMKDKFGHTAYTQQAALMTAKVFADKGNTDAAKAALSWVADKASDEGYQAVARLRLASILLNTKAYDEALKQLSWDFPKDFEPLVQDRRGDVYLLQGKKAEAKAEYIKAFKGFDERAEYRHLVEVKLGSLGVDPQQLAAAAQAPTGGAKP